MSTSRRKFLRTGLLATLFAAVPLKHVLGQSWKNRDGNPGETPPAQSDPLNNYSKATFTSYLNSIFQLQTFGGVVEVTLLQVGDMPAPKGGECFSLLFRGGNLALRQDNYMLVHPALGAFHLLLVPVGTDQNGAQGYLATINRLSAVDFANMSAPSVAPRSAPSSASPSASPSTSSPPTTTSPPVVTPTVTPTLIPTAPPVIPVTPAPVRKPRKRRRRKPSWKNDDDQRMTLVH